MRVLPAGISAILAAALAACGASDEAADASGAATAEEGREVVYSGPLDETSVPGILARLEPDTERLVITSPGGEIDASIDLGRAVRARNIEVVVRGYCFSGCAHFVFAPARRKRVEDNAIVGFHGTATARQELFARSGRWSFIRRSARSSARLRRRIHICWQRVFPESACRGSSSGRPARGSAPATHGVRSQDF